MIDRDEREGFKSYLVETLIPDLKKSGHLGTALDFETCLQIIDEMETRYEKHNTEHASASVD